MTMSSGRRTTGRRVSKSGPRSSAGRARLPTMTGCTNSTETCWASVAAEPLPKARSRPPARNRRDISWQASARRGASVLKKASKTLLRRSSCSLLRTARTFVSTVISLPVPAGRLRGFHLGERVDVVTGEVVDGCHGQQPLALFVGGDVVDPRAAMLANDVAALLQLALIRHLLRVLGHAHDGVDDFSAKPGEIQLPHHQELHRSDPPGDLNKFSAADRRRAYLSCGCRRTRCT